MGIGCFAIGDEEFDLFHYLLSCFVHPLDLGVLGGSLALAEHVYPNRVGGMAFEATRRKNDMEQAICAMAPCFYVHRIIALVVSLEEWRNYTRV
ncbi:hypothetical protein IFM89_021664 [Coptis chinensis]|uniref:Uncharacterized protein n=1 Tax=Coptis chinensis TaxID=261450 RepID=A0A835IEH7_9MAGN|nr:hypothetical protein IFM89_021664 [Coptis chinensis]